MLAAIKRFFDEHLAVDASGSAADSDQAVRLAASALLLEMTRMDGEIRAEQRAAVDNAVRNCFGLGEAQADELLALAEAERDEATDYYQFTSLINASYGPDQKLRLVEVLWRVALANQVLDSHEEFLVRKVADLLYVPHGDYIAAKLRAAGA